MPNFKPRNKTKTRAALIMAAMEEFESVGYENTNSNKIAARANYSPQTFYRYFPNKLEVFLAAYQNWSEGIVIALEESSQLHEISETTIAHHKANKNFRRTLRHLSVTEPLIRAARTESRLRQIEALKTIHPHLKNISMTTLLASLLQVERLFDAVADGEFADLGISAIDAEKEIRSLLKSRFGI